MGGSKKKAMRDIGAKSTAKSVLSGVNKSYAASQISRQDLEDFNN